MALDGGDGCVMLQIPPSSALRHGQVANPMSSYHNKKIVFNANNNNNNNKTIRKVNPERQCYFFYHPVHVAGVQKMCSTQTNRQMSTPWDSACCV